MNPQLSQIQRVASVVALLIGRESYEAGRFQSLLKLTETGSRSVGSSISKNGFFVKFP